MFFRSKNIAFGLDVSDRSIKLAELKLRKNIHGEESLVLTGHNELFIPPDIIVDGEIKNYPAAVQAIKTCLKNVRGRPLSARAVVASLPESQCYLKMLDTPKNNVEAISPKIIRGLACQHFPTEENELYYDWQIINGNKIIIGAAARNTVDSYAEIIEQAGLIPLSLEIESIAIARALIKKEGARKNDARVLIDLGAGHSSIIVVRDGNPILTLNMPLSGNAMTKAIAESQKLTIERAEALKIKCGLDLKNCPASVKKTIGDIINSSVKQIRCGLQYVGRILKYRFDKIYICGGVAGMNKIAPILSDRLKIKVRLADPLANIILDKTIKLAGGELLKYTTAIGLAIRGTEYDLLKLKK